MGDEFDPAIRAQLASDHVRENDHTLTVDATLRSVVLGPGGWELYGIASQSYFAVRACTKAGAAITGERAFPILADFAAPTQGTPDPATALWAAGFLTGDPATDAVGGTGSVARVGALPTDTAVPIKIAVPASGYRRLYVVAPGGATTGRLRGPF